MTMATATAMIPLAFLNVIAPPCEPEDAESNEPDYHECAYNDDVNAIYTIVTSTLTRRKSEPAIKLRRGNLRRSPKLQSLPSICEHAAGLQRHVTF